MTVNGVTLETDNHTSGVHTNALDALRSHGLTACKEGCGEGECGACAIMVARPDGNDADRTRWVPVNACLIPAAALDGQEIVTAEGLGTPSDLHPVQREMAERGGSQCGYCTPGFVCSMAAEYYRPETEKPFDLHALSGNLCRCTGYRPIKDAAMALGTGADADTDARAARLREPAPGPAPTDVHAGDARFRRPASLSEALEILSDDPSIAVVAGSTDHGVGVNLKGERPADVIAVDRLPELRGITVTDTYLDIGAAQTLTEIERALGKKVPLLGQLLPQFASRLIRNSATIGGNLGTGSPIGDTPPALLALEASLVLTSVGGEREVALCDYFTGYRRSVRQPDELITRIRIPLPLSPLTAFHKIAKRRFDDISSVAVGFAVDVQDGLVTKARIGLGGVAATPVRALETEAALEGAPWTEETILAAAEILRGEGTPMSDHRASSAYRSAMLGTSLERFWAEQQRQQEVRA
ncbi:MAG TPA: FAD binding domain-containing protein [Candidatus Corynebacterium avicola]|uniref:FAD binding domain-containing protein n=1 Tax=Candidatus Corynebacterium avicola TaxID=2838527 RepID=A0A9D1RPC0_9CORY|nr:FAD binding domain-containing protein [Candidatus Corynebacterium avicola]